MIGIIDYGLGNVKAFLNSYSLLGIKSTAVSTSEQLYKADHLILPGVGSFDNAIDKLNSSGLREPLDAIANSKRIPILGVCLGHQALAQAYGGKIIRANELMHGKTSKVIHTGEGIFTDLPQPLTATRYHSLIVDRSSLPSCLEVTAWLKDKTIMGLRHRKFSHLQGVQFHPESVLSEAGHQLLSNFLVMAESNSKDC